MQRAARRWVNAILIISGFPTTSVGIRVPPSPDFENPDFESREVLTSRAKYAVRATLVLAELKAPNVWTSATELAEAAVCWKAGGGRRAGIGWQPSRSRYRPRT
jgi:hypothetical protein